MSFTSSIFLIFLFFVFLVYFLIPKKFQWGFLLIASYVFYLFSGFGKVLFLLFTTTITFCTGILLEKTDTALETLLENKEKLLSKEQRNNLKESSKRKKRIILISALLLVLGVLGVLKYYNFFAQNFNSLADILSLDVELSLLNYLLPLGISFYTFQSVGYIIDINRGKIKADKNLAKFALFLSFFPQIVQGPISRYSQLANQLYEPHTFNYERVKSGLQLMLWGFFKKLVIADRLAVAVNTIFGNSIQYEGLSIFIGVLFFTFQMYCDFSGGIDIARGIAETMGISMVENFRRPFFSKSIDEYWRRWHITLGDWMRDYVFYPLALSKTFARLGKFSRKHLGNKTGKIIPIIIANLITFLAVGVWHGPYWKYVAFGTYYGLLISIGILFKPFFQKIGRSLKIKTDCFSWRLTQISFVFTATTIGRYFARADGLRHAFYLLKQTFSIFNPWIFYDGTLLNLGLNLEDYYVLFVSILFLILVEILQEIGINIREKISDQNLVFRWSLYLIGIFAVLIFGMYGQEYSAVEFIYRGF